MIRKKVEATQETYALLAATAIDAETYFTHLFPAPEQPAGGDDDKYAERLARWTAHQQRLLELYASGQGSDLPGVRGTAWGAYNVVTEWVDHHLQAHHPSGPSDGPVVTGIISLATVSPASPNSPSRLSNKSSDRDLRQEGRVQDPS